MHDELIGCCDHCRQFVFAFAKESPLANWGFCLAECGGALPGEGVRAEIEVAFQRGDTARVYGTKGLYEESEEGCERFEPR